jgi:predicted alpha/beta-hydrolase family hydrolase
MTDEHPPDRRVHADGQRPNTPMKETENDSRNNPDLLVDGPRTAACTVILAHGAGAPMDTDFMNFFAEGLARHGLRVVRFEFPYMAKRRKTGKGGPPDREPVLRQTWLGVIESVKAKSVFIGGKSMGGRIASLVADEAAVAGLVCLGYPFHPTGKPEQLRTEHLKSIKTPTLIVQGQRDPFGTRQEVAGYKLAGTVQMHWLLDGDHSFKPRKSSGRTEEQNWSEGVEVIAEFVKSSERD